MGTLYYIHIYCWWHGACLAPEHHHSATTMLTNTHWWSSYHTWVNSQDVLTQCSCKEVTHHSKSERPAVCWVQGCISWSQAHYIMPTVLIISLGGSICRWKGRHIMCWDKSEWYSTLITGRRRDSNDNKTSKTLWPERPKMHNDFLWQYYMIIISP